MLLLPLAAAATAADAADAADAIATAGRCFLPLADSKNQYQHQVSDRLQTERSFPRRCWGIDSVLQARWHGRERMHGSIKNTAVKRLEVRVGVSITSKILSWPGASTRSSSSTRHQTAVALVHAMQLWFCLWRVHLLLHIWYILVQCTELPYEVPVGTGTRYGVVPGTSGILYASHFHCYVCTWYFEVYDTWYLVRVIVRFQTADSSTARVRRKFL